MKKITARSFQKNLHGQTIIEIILSIGIATLVITSLVILGSVSLRTALSSARRAEASKLAVSGLEAMRFYRDQRGFSNLAEGCYQIEADGQITSVSCPTEETGWVNINLSGGSTATEMVFGRKIEISEYGSSAEEQAKMRLITSTVRWTESGGSLVGGVESQKSVVMSSVLSSWE